MSPYDVVVHVLAFPTVAVLLLAGAVLAFRWAAWVVSLVAEVDTSQVHEEGDHECVVRARFHARPEASYALGRAWNVRIPFSWRPARFEIKHAPRPYWKVRASTVRGLAWCGFVVSRRSYDDPAADAEAEAKEAIRLDAIRARREALIHPVAPGAPVVTSIVPNNPVVGVDTLRTEIGVSCRGCGGVHAAPACAQPSPCCWRCSPNYSRMLLCPTCGNKRCPRANDHDNVCTGSNDLGQLGSRYAHTEPAWLRPCGTCDKDPCRCKHGECY